MLITSITNAHERPVIPPMVKNSQNIPRAICFINYYIRIGLLSESSISANMYAQHLFMKVRRKANVIPTMIAKHVQYTQNISLHSHLRTLSALRAIMTA